MKTIAYEDNGVVIKTFMKGVEVDVAKYIDVTGVLLPKEHSCSWYIEDGEIKVDQQKLIEFNRSRMPSLSRRQFNQAVRKFGLRAQIDTVVAAIEDSDKREEIEIDLADSDTFERMSSSILMMTELLGITQEQVDDMWLVALEI